jgi:pimeloyl-ACP methyl ester carboxylesterase
LPEYFRHRRIAGNQAFDEHLPPRAEARANGKGEARLYGAITRGDLAEFDVLDTRQYRSDHPCGDGERARCDASFDPAQTMLGVRQERWLEHRLRHRDIRRSVLANQVMVTELDHDPGPGAVHWQDSWDGYPAARARLIEQLDQTRNPLMMTGDWHSTFVNDLRPDHHDASSPVIATKIIAPAITSNGYGPVYGPYYGPMIAWNPHAKFFEGDRKGYVRGRADRHELVADIGDVDHVGTSGAAILTFTSFAVEDGRRARTRCSSALRSLLVSELRLPWLPDGRTVRIEGRGEFFVRQHRHPDPAAPTVLLLHGWTASTDLQFFTAYLALAERYSFVGIDHRGHGRGLRSPDPFRLEDAADDAAAVVGSLGVAPVVAVGYSMGGPIALHLAQRHPNLVRGLVVQATALEWTSLRRERALWRVLPLVGSWLRTKGYRRYLNKAVPKLLGAGHPVEEYIPWLVSEMARNDPLAMVDAGRALADYDARPWASALGVPAASLITMRDRLATPAKQRVLAVALGAEMRELPADHFAALAEPIRFAALTVELVDVVVSRGERRSAAERRAREASEGGVYAERARM